MGTIVIPQRSSVRPPVSTASALPSSGNLLGDQCVAQDTGVLYTWTSGGWGTNAGPPGPPGPPGASGSGGSSFAPTDLAGLTAWLRATSLGLASGDSIATWSDPLSGGGLPFSDGGQPSVRPVFAGSATPQGRAAALFDGASQHLTSAAPLSSFIGSPASSWAVFAAFRATAVTHSGVAAYQNDLLLGDAHQYMGFYLRAGSPPSLIAYNWHGAEQALTAPVTISNGWHVAYMRLSAGTLYLSVDGGAETSIASGPTDDIGGAVILGGIGGLYYTGSVAEALIYSTAPSSADAQRVVAALQAYNGT